MTTPPIGSSTSINWGDHNYSMEEFKQAFEKLMKEKPNLSIDDLIDRVDELSRMADEMGNVNPLFEKVRSLLHELKEEGAEIKILERKAELELEREVRDIRRYEELLEILREKMKKLK